ncbi:hypothetical protein HZS_5409 [Henneguya salminicola]|nr:hypothetical protein HZS_5409 [Henneguya salminicola]
MFEATFIQGTLFRQIIDALKDLVTDVNIECTAGGLRAQAMEPSHISLASLKITPDCFDSYRCDRNIVLGLNVASVSKILKCLEAGDFLSLSCGEKADTVNFCITSKKMDKISNFELKLININPETLSIPDEQADTEISIPSSKFGQICRDLLNFGDTVKIISSKNSIELVSDGSLGSARITLKPTSEIDDDDKEQSGKLKIECHETVDQSYSLKFLSFFSKAQSLSKEFTISLFNSSPLCVECKLNEGEWGHLKGDDEDKEDN